MHAASPGRRDTSGRRRGSRPSPASHDARRSRTDRDRSARRPDAGSREHPCTTFPAPSREPAQHPRVTGARGRIHRTDQRGHRRPAGPFAAHREEPPWGIGARVGQSERAGLVGLACREGWLSQPAESSEATAVSLPAELLAVLEGMAHGLLNSEIARGLCISQDAVKFRARSIYRLLGARSRAHAVAIAYRQGLLAPEPGEAMQAAPSDPPSRSSPAEEGRPEI